MPSLEVEQNLHRLRPVGREREGRGCIAVRKSLPDVVMTPHMSGWTDGMIRRHQRAMADNVLRRFAGEDCENVVRCASPEQFDKGFDKLSPNGS